MSVLGLQGRHPAAVSVQASRGGAGRMQEGIGRAGGKARQPPTTGGPGAPGST